MSVLALVVLDMAGTLLDDGGAVLNAFRSALSAEQLQFSEPELQAVRGSNKRAVFEHFATRALGTGCEAEQATLRAYERFESELSREYREGPLQPVAGAEAALQAMRGLGLKLASNTGLPRSLAGEALARLRWKDGVFDARVCGDEVSEGRPAPYMIYLALQRTGVSSCARVLTVGDTPLDLRAGVNAGAAGVVGVLTGSHDAISLGRVRHTHIIPSVAELPGLLLSEFS